MVEAVAAHGYERTSVKEVVGLAGVSRRSFYEQFANKEECFLASFDVIVARTVRQIRDACRASEGDLEHGLRAAFGQCAEAIKSNPKRASLVVVHAQNSGPAGLLRLVRATSTCEQVLSSSFTRAPEASPLPKPVVRGITGGLHALMSLCLREGDPREAPALVDELVRWTLLFQTPAAASMSASLIARARVGAPTLQSGAASGHAPNGRSTQHPGERERLLQSTLRLVAVDHYQELSAPQIAGAANLPIEVFLELFADKEECFLAALDMLSDELLLIASEPVLTCSSWSYAVRRALGEMMRHLADHPLYAQTIAVEAFAAGPAAIERNLALQHAIITLLLTGAPDKKMQSRLRREAVAGAIWHTIRCQVTSGQIQLLPALSDYLAYVVLAPFIGAEAAAEVVTRPEPHTGRAVKTRVGTTRIGTGKARAPLARTV